jgi:hypothetical protein
VYKFMLFAILALWLIQPLLLTANEAHNPINDPMRPPAFALQKYQQAKNKNKPKVVAVQRNSVKSKALKLTSILYSSTRKIAIIDEKMLSVGDSINGARLVSVKKDSARLIKNGKTISLRLSNQSKNIRKTVVQKTMAEKKL